MPCGWEGNRKSGVALAMRHRLQWFIHLRARGLRKGDEHPNYTPRGYGTPVSLPSKQYIHEYAVALQSTVHITNLGTLQISTTSAIKCGSGYTAHSQFLYNSVTIVCKR